MTGLQIYGLVVPFVLLGLGWLAGWLNHRATVRSRQGKRPHHVRAAA